MPGAVGMVLYVLIDDLNGDGRPDLAAPVFSRGGAVAVLLQSGAGPQFSGTSYPAGTYPHSIASGDFNGDRVPDLATAGPTSVSGSSSILLGLGGGRFSAPRNLDTAGRGSAQLVARDLSRDGKIDLASAAGGAGGVLVLIGNGDGSFRSPVTYRTGTNAASVAAADLNGDGAEDLAVANYISGSLSVLLGRGDGSFPPAAQYPLSALRPCTVPRLIGKTLAAARKTLAHASCTVGEVTRRRSRVAKGRVIAQGTPPGDVSYYAYPVDLVISRGRS